LLNERQEAFGAMLLAPKMVLEKPELISSLQNEVRLLLHLCGKAKPEMFDYRPTPKQRSLIELLRYMTVLMPLLVPSIKGGTFSVDDWTAGEARAASMDFDALLKTLESQAALYAELVGAMSDDELRGEIEMFGMKKMTRGTMLVNLLLCGHSAYRMQLFCYLKACGREELNTMNLWMGIDGSM
jgi:hypothetical protein